MLNAIDENNENYWSNTMGWKSNSNLISELILKIKSIVTIQVV